MVNTPNSGCKKLLNILSYTEHCSFGQYNGSPGNGSVNLMQVLIVGFAPAGPG